MYIYIYIYDMLKASLYHNRLFMACHIFTAVYGLPIKFPPDNFTSGNCHNHKEPDTKLIVTFLEFHFPVLLLVSYSKVMKILSPC